MIEIMRFAYFFGITTTLSIITLFMRGAYQQSWLHFAWWGGAIVIFFIIRINLGTYHSGGGFFNMDDFIDTVYTTLAYAFFIIGSAIQLLRVYLKNRRQKAP